MIQRLVAAATVLLAATAVSASRQSPPVIPSFWDRDALHDYELPLATPGATPTHVSRDYYYALPERVLYRSYPIYHPDREPPGYLDRVRAAQPERAFDPAVLRSDADWIAAGQRVFEMPIDYGGPVVTMANVRDPQWYAQHRMPLSRDGVMPFARYVVRESGRVEVGNLACSMCHSRVMPDGAVIAGAQGNFPFDQVFAAQIPRIPPAVVPVVFQALVGAPWDAAGSARLKAMTAADFRHALERVPPGVLVRQGTSVFAPPAIPDLIGLRDRRYLDKTGLGRHRGIADVMRYAAINQTLDVLAAYDGFIPAARDGKTLAPPGQGQFNGAADRYTDAQLFALGRYIYSLTPPANPNAVNARTRRGQEIFTASGCARCHTPPLYTANKLVPADGFTPPAITRSLR